MVFELFNIKKIFDTRGYSQIFEFSKLYKNKFQRIYFSNNKKKGTLRGLHYQKKYKQNKLLIVKSGVIFDVLIDLNKKSKKYKKVYSFKIGDKQKFNCIFIPSNFAHGFQTLTNDTNLIYLIDNKFEIKNELIRYNDPEFKIQWPIKKLIISKKDTIKQSKQITTDA